MGLGWFLSSYATNIWLLTLTYGVIAGSGVGLVYGCPVAMGAKWFPDKKGLAVGLMLAGFGGSALITGKIASILIPSVGLSTTFMYFGIAFGIILVILSLPFRFPALSGFLRAGNLQRERSQRQISRRVKWLNPAHSADCLMLPYRLYSRSDGYRHIQAGG